MAEPAAKALPIFRFTLTARHKSKAQITFDVSAPDGKSARSLAALIFRHHLLEVKEV